MAPRSPAVSIGLKRLPPSPSTHSLSDSDSDELETPRKPWYLYLPVCGTFIFLLAPHPSLLYVFVDFHLRTLQKPLLFTIHVLVTYTLSFMALSSLVVCVTRNPGRVFSDKGETDNAEIGVAEMLMCDDFAAPGRWCRKCWAPKPERAHHCSTCGQCVLKMDHHCPWLGSCIGHRTYPAFLHFLGSITALALYIAIMAVFAIVYAFNNPYNMTNTTTPVHILILAFGGIVTTLVVGSFFCYHLYLASTNQTTIENISPFMLLKHLPPLPRGNALSDPPMEHELSAPQRRLVKDAHQAIHLYDVGWRRNWSQVLGRDAEHGWLIRLWYGGSSLGDGKHFTRNLRADEMLAVLASELVKLDRSR